MKKKLFTIAFILLYVLNLTGQNTSKNAYWIKLKDKSGTPNQIDQPEKFLSQRAIERRIRQHIAIDETDLPVSSIYLDSLRKMGLEIVHTSKWLNGVTVRTADAVLIQEIADLSFVSAVQLTKHATTLKSAFNKFNETEDPSSYGNAWAQLSQLNGQYLHNQGFRGKGIQIAVLDGGFYHVDRLAAFDILRNSGRILGVRDFVNPTSNFYEQNTHGMSVLSCMGGNIPGSLVGTAPDASYYLIRTEDVNSENLIEEDNWVAGAELADSLGVDVINSSLGYTQFDDPLMNHVYADMDGKTTHVTQGANMAFQKGILVFTSAGNEGANAWMRIVAPSDGKDVISVGAVGSDGIRAYFSSLGPGFGGAVKPNVAARGYSTYLLTSSGVLGTSSGTSFSSPVLAGMGACLIQANPYAGVKLVKEAIEQSASQFATPDSLLGYGIPDFKKADQFLKTNSIEMLSQRKEWTVFPNPFKQSITIRNADSGSTDHFRIGLYNIQGVCLKESNISSSGKLVLDNLANFPEGLYLLKIDSGKKSETIKLVKSGN